MNYNKFILYLSICALIGACVQQEEWIEAFDGAQLSIRHIKGAKNLPTLVFVHGWCCNQEFWRYQTDYFMDKYPILTVDLAGYGNSESREKHSFDNWGEDVIAAVEAVDPESYILIGHSSGGYVVLNAATKADDRLKGIVGIDSYRGKMVADISVEFAKEAGNKNRVPVDTLKEMMQNIDHWFVLNSDPEDVNWIKDEMGNCLVETAAQGVQEYYLYRNHVADDFRRLQIPVFGINKTKSQFDDAFFSENKIDFTPYYVEDAGHFVMMDQPQAVNGIIKMIVAQME
jgi:pimeloyl-ACP methyl ester carboxylesterase